MINALKPTSDISSAANAALETRSLGGRGHQPADPIQASLRATQIDLVGSRRLPSLRELYRGSHRYELILELVLEKAGKILQPRYTLLAQGGHPLDESSGLFLLLMQVTAPFEVRTGHFQSQLLRNQDDAHGPKEEALVPDPVGDVLDGTVPKQEWYPISAVDHAREKECEPKGPKRHRPHTDEHQDETVDVWRVVSLVPKCNQDNHCGGGRVDREGHPIDHAPKPVAGFSQERVQCQSRTEPHSP